MLDSYRPILLDVQAGRCFYCRQDLKRSVEVDHFIPWSRYPTDLGHNFVLVHPACNNAKSDYIAAEDHLAAWATRNREHADELDARLTEVASPTMLRPRGALPSGHTSKRSVPTARFGLAGLCSSICALSGGDCWWRDFCSCEQGQVSWHADEPAGH